MRRAALALARDVERRVPRLATTKWWKEERHGVFIDYNQNAKDRTVAGAYSIRPTADARVSAPLYWNEVADVDPAAFTLATMPARFAEIGDRHRGIDDAASPSRPARIVGAPRARRPGRRAVAAAVREGRGRADACPPSRLAAAKAGTPTNQSRTRKRPSSRKAT